MGAPSVLEATNLTENPHPPRGAPPSNAARASGADRGGCLHGPFSVSDSTSGHRLRSIGRSFLTRPGSRQNLHDRRPARLSPSRPRPRSALDGPLPRPPAAPEQPLGTAGGADGRTG